MDPESMARLIDAFVDSLDLSDYGVKEHVIQRITTSLKISWMTELSG